jgi:transcription elongation factor Elf1
MTKRTSPFKRAAKAAKQAMGPQRYGAQDKPFACPFCGHDRFQQGDYIALLAMHTLVCGGCGHVEFFKKKPELVES